MIRGSKKLIAFGVLAALAAGCHDDTPHEYGQARPDPNQLSADDSGLQSKDVQAATAQITSEFLSLPELNASQTQWTLVVDHMDDLTIDRSFGPVNYDIFLQSLRSSISERGQGRVRLIENKAKFEDVRNRELEGPSDQFQQGGGAQPPAAAINPDYVLTGKAMDMPNRSTNYYQLEFDITNMKTRELVLSRTYTVKVAR
jgi:hypothetical protein